MNRSPWHVAATVVPDPEGIAAIRRWLSASDTTGTKAKVLPTPEGSQAQQAEWSSDPAGVGTGDACFPVVSLALNHRLPAVKPPA